MKTISALLFLTVFFTSARLFAQSPPNGTCETVLEFDGTNDYIDVEDGVYFDDNTFTIEAWVYPRAFTNWERVIDFGNGQAVDNVLLAISEGNSGHPALSLIMGPGAQTQNIVAATALSLNTWTHLAVVLDGSNVHFYYNGTLEGSYATTVTVNNVTRAQNYIAKSNWPSDPYFNGLIDEVRIWNVARSATEIADNKDLQLTDSETDLLAYWQMNEMTGLTAFDRSVNDYQGSLNNMDQNTCWKTSGGQPNPCKAGALDFDGVDDHLSVSDAEELRITNQFTLEFWMKSKDLTQTNKYILGRSDGDIQWAIVYEHVDNQVEFYSDGASSGDNPRPGSQISITDDSWHHIAYTYDGTVLKGYLDGTNVLSETKSFSLESMPGGDWYIGASYAAGTNNANIQMDEIRIWNRPLCEEELQHRKDCELTGTEYGLHAYYNFTSEAVEGVNNGLFSDANDAAPGGHTATLNSFSLAGTSSNWVRGNISGNCSGFNPFSLNISGETTACEETELDAGNPGMSYLWSDASTAQTLTVTSSGDYHVKVTDLDGCMEFDTVSVTIRNLPTVDAGTDQVICSGESGITLQPTTDVSLDASTDSLVLSQSTYLAIPDNNPTGIQSSISVSLPYTFDASGLLAVVLDTITHTYVTDLDITLIAPDGSSIILSSDNGVSGGDHYYKTVLGTSGPSITTGIAPMSGTYTPEEPFSSLTGSANGSWKLKIVDDASGDVGALKKWSLIFPVENFIETYSWSPSTGLSSATIAAPEANPVNNTVYTLTVTDKYGCENSDEVSINVDVCTNISSGPGKEDLIRLYPNPNNGSFTMNISGQMEGSIEISDALGKIIYTRNQISESMEIFLEDVPAGMYYLQLQSGSDVIVKRIIKK